MNRSFTSFFLFLSLLASITAFTPIVPSHRFPSTTKVLKNTRKLDFLPQIDNYGNNGGIIVGGGGDGEGGDNNGGGDNNDGGNSNDNNSGGNPLTSALGSFWTNSNFPFHICRQVLTICLANSDKYFFKYLKHGTIVHTKSDSAARQKTHINTERSEHVLVEYLLLLKNKSKQNTLMTFRASLYR